MESDVPRSAHHKVDFEPAMQRRHVIKCVSLHSLIIEISGCTCINTPICSIGHNASDDNGLLRDHSSWDRVGVWNRLKTQKRQWKIVKTKKL